MTIREIDTFFITGPKHLRLGGLARSPAPSSAGWEARPPCRKVLAINFSNLGTPNTHTHVLGSPLRKLLKKQGREKGV